MKSEKGGIVAVLLIIIFVVFLIMVFSSVDLLKQYLDVLTKREKDELDSYRKWEKKTYGNNI